ncbi:2-C-methyl-D-erythritol 2,4-cyclodiphosphate synthase [candidate division WOR-3 bacterium]|nr:2-C-methyl-D-erythritol 2,4-cyclodiphosphate synthase [candidate division WOR-3 bacterium]
MGFSAVIVAGGSGRRFSGPIPKQALMLFGLKMWEWSVRAFDSADECEEIIVVTPKDADPKDGMFHTRQRFKHPVIFTVGGKERRDSVFNGVEISKSKFVAIHDAARPFIGKDLIERLWQVCRKGVPVIPVAEIFDTIKEVDHGFVKKTVDRKYLRRAQTPQFFPKSLIGEALGSCQETLTDDSSYAEKLDLQVMTIPGDENNFKITTADDFQRAKIIISSYSRVGFGLDFHRLSENRDLIIGGVKIPFELGLLGHSDADVLLHAITDALLGACGMRDIGFYFPDNDQKYLGVSSSYLLEKAYEKSGFPHILNVDSVVVAQSPALSPYIPVMIKNISRILSCNESSVSVKATTSEGMGPEGAKEGISARAVVNLLKI